jgi:hypothetical protein
MAECVAWHYSGYELGAAIVAAGGQRWCKSFLRQPESKKSLAPRKSTSSPKADIPFENVTAKLSNRGLFIGYSLDSRGMDRQNMRCFALIEAERPGLHSAGWSDGYSHLVGLRPNFIASSRLPEGGR